MNKLTHTYTAPQCDKRCEGSDRMLWLGVMGDKGAHFRRRGHPGGNLKHERGHSGGLAQAKALGRASVFTSRDLRRSVWLKGGV